MDGEAEAQGGRRRQATSSRSVSRSPARRRGAWSPRHRAPLGAGATLAAGTLSVVFATLPVFGLGGLAVLVRADLGFSESQLGTAVGLYFGVSSLAAVPAGRIAQRIGAFRGMAVGATASAVAMLGVATMTRSYVHLVCWMAVGSLSNAFGQPSGNLALARRIAPARQGTAFGVKQSATLVATLLGGLAVPAVGLTVGWRWAFLAGAVAAAAFALAVARPDGHAVGTGGTTPAAAAHPARPPLAPLAVLAAGAALGTAATTSLGAFFVESAVHHGVAPGAAGLWFAAGSVSGIAARIALGWGADRSARSQLHVVAGLLVAGAAGFALLPGRTSVPALAAATVLSFAAGWGWTGLYNLAVVREHPGAAASATGVTVAGFSFGGMAGPIAFGMIAEHGSYAAAWWTIAVLTLVSAGAVAAAKPMFDRHGGRG